MNSVSILSTLIASILIIGMIPFQAQTQGSRDTPADAVRAAGNIKVSTLDLKGASSVAFESIAFQKENITGGKPNKITIDENTSRNEMPGQPASLKSWMDRSVPNPDNVTDDADYSSKQGLNKISSGFDYSKKSNVSIKDIYNLTTL